ncbi:hypothetical protein HC031_10105 [Planosporangium thailandense]|uniref:Uncharacterized protein n=1 Tax=Planosporangium thailandense TaxID=765197 RepID=A0ABX0XXS7_9ACTN|nr:hypothetical protein [Planosporangium thailandense]NJC70059.1 hypothetical protein [Planosporangium thailandense]
MGRGAVPGLDASAAESLLRGDLGHAGAPDVLVHLLTAATAPARPHELDGEEAALAAFRAPALAPGHPSRRRTLVTRLLTVKVTAAFALTAAGGVALAAVDALPRIPGVSSLGSRFGGRATSGAGLAPGATTSGAGRQSASPRSTPTPLPSTHPSPENLCLLLLADRPTGPAGIGSSGLDSQALATLIALAGGDPAAVGPYCSRLLGVPVRPASQLPSPASAATPANPASPTAPLSPQPRSASLSARPSPSASKSHSPRPSPVPTSSQPDPNAADRSPSSTPATRSATVSSSRGGHR